MRRLVVVVLAAGKGKRMCSSIPKVLHKCGNKPMLIRVLETVKHIDPQKIIVVAGEHQDQLEDSVLEWMGGSHGVCFIRQPTPLGTGHAVLCCLPEFQPEDAVLIVNGDMPLITHTLLENLLSVGADGAVMTVIMDDPTGYGRIIHTETHFQIMEEKDCNVEQKKICEVNAGVYVFIGKILMECLPKLNNDNEQHEYYLTSILQHTGKYNVQTFHVEKGMEYMVMGVNTAEELLKISIMAQDQ